uniref:28S ribosomal protein S14, mitochondrial n=1 Tax=Lynceus sp. MCZ IZ 141354 TaxID=1930659 RepID=A0A9N6WRU3_9CRUS|nr:EOG090X0MNX [Lynceus sp. MCZ IZ 141354]
MSYLTSVLGRLPSLGYTVSNPLIQQVRFKWANWNMLKDYKRRQAFEKFGADRMRLNAIRKNDIIPFEIKEIADKEVAALPRDASIVRIRQRCAVTSRSRGVVMRWRLSRMVWRHLADNNKLSSVQRAMW